MGSAVMPVVAVASLIVVVVRRARIGTLLMRSLACAVALIAMVGIAACSNRAEPSAAERKATTAHTSPSVVAESSVRPLAALQDSYETVLERVRPSVVQIATDAGLGSGVVYDAQGDIVTNYHVVAGSTHFRVSFLDGRTLDATLVGAYPPDDLAVIKVNASDLPRPAVLADSSKVRVGEITLAIGNPLGLASSVTDGIVSFSGRSVDEGNGVVLPSTIQTSAPINPGNSGGALVDLNGAVIGIPTLAATDPQLGGGAAPGIGFAIPSNTVRRIADQLVRDGKVTDSGRAALGIAGSDVVDRGGQPMGVLVRSVQPHQSAANAGIAPGDVITAVAGKPTLDLDALAGVLATLAPSDGVTVDASRPDGTHHSFHVTLGDLSIP